jgi:hypothetical protein
MKAGENDMIEKNAKKLREPLVESNGSWCFFENDDDSWCYSLTAPILTIGWENN